jgi:hypothetical protein
MKCWPWSLLALLAACVDIGAPPSLNRVDALPIENDASVVEPDAAEAAPEAGPAVDAELDAAVAIEPDAAEADAAALEPDAGEPDAPLVMNGRPCSASTQCESKVCTDGVCCGGPCTTLCHACNVAGSLGTCVPVSAGQDPDEECPQDPVSSCGRDGTCNGQGACRRYPENTQCAPGGCTGDQQHAASTCNGAGACIPGKVMSCSPHVCMNDSCASSCSKPADCQTGFYCDGAACRTTKPPGQACTTAAECASGNCADKVCCSTPCSETCHSCALPGSVGTCTVAVNGSDPREECAVDEVACGRDGLCDGKGGCRLRAAGVACGPELTCTGSTETGASACNGLGVCAPGANRDCQGYRCNGAACGTACTTAAQCKAGYSCTAGACVAMPAPALYWKLDEASGTTALDASGNNLAGTYAGTSGTPVTSPMIPTLGFPDPASRAFTRANRHIVTLANMPAAIKPVNELTLSVWYRATTIDTGPSGSMAGSELVSGGDNYLMRLHIGDLEMSKRTANGHVQCLGVVTNHLDGNWHHAAAVYGPTTLTVYFDGVPKISCPISAPFAYDRGKDLFVGRHGNDTTNAALYDFEGNMDEVRIYTRALSATEIAALAAGN